jgi:hypothetical protein
MEETLHIAPATALWAKTAVGGRKKTPGREPKYGLAVGQKGPAEDSRWEAKVKWGIAGHQVQSRSFFPFPPNSRERWICRSRCSTLSLRSMLTTHSFSAGLNTFGSVNSVTIS